MNQTINISLPKGLSDLAQAQVDAGYYSSVSEVIRDGLRNILMEPGMPTYPMSDRLEKIGLQALKDHKAGKTHLLKNVDDLADL